MPINIPIKPLGEIKYIDRLNDIYRMALATKGQEFYADPITNKLYGFYDEYFSIIDISIPFKVSNPIYFQSTMCYTQGTKEIIESVPLFFYSTEYPFFLFSENRRWDFMNGNLEFTFGDKENKYGIIDKTTGKYVNDCIVLITPNVWFMSNRHINTLNAYYNRLNSLNAPFIYKNYHETEYIKSIQNSKVSTGSSICYADFLDSNNRERKYVFYAFKNLIGPLNKPDKLDLLVYQDKYEQDKFMVTFRIHKTNKLKIPEIGTNYICDTHAFMINLARRDL